MGLTRDENGKIEEALDAAVTAFDAAMVERFPELKNGDAPRPDLVRDARYALSQYAEEWLAAVRF